MRGININLVKAQEIAGDPASGIQELAAFRDEMKAAESYCDTALTEMGALYQSDPSNVMEETKELRQSATRAKSPVVLAENLSQSITWFNTITACLLEEYQKASCGALEKHIILCRSAAISQLAAGYIRQKLKILRMNEEGDEGEDTGKGYEVLPIPGTQLAIVRDRILAGLPKAKIKIRLSAWLAKQTRRC